jgi:hypothetical protein
MELKDQVVSLDLARRLKELGVKQDSLFFYWKPENEINEHYILIYEQNLSIHEYIKNKSISAFTCAELLNILPHKVDTKKDEPFNFFRLNLEKSFIVDLEKLNMTDIYIVNYICDSTETGGENAWFRRTLVKNMSDENPANALSKMLIYLIENKSINLTTEK